MSDSASHDQPTCLMIPGFGEKTGEKPYAAVRRELERSGWRVVPVGIHWSRTAMTGWLKQAREVIEKQGKVDMVFGFSFGAMMALLLATENEIETVIAASPSPYFKECLRRLPSIAEKMLGRRRMRDFEKYSLASVKKITSSRVELIVGGDDFPPLVAVVKKLHRMLEKNSRLTMVEDAPHDLGDAHYLKAVMRILARNKPRGSARNEKARTEEK